jgi:hypothetical protein
MPAEETSRLNNDEYLLPTANSACEQYQEESIGPGTRWAFHLSTEDDQLLAQQRIFCDEFGLGASKIGESSCQEGSALWPCPVQYTVLDPNERGMGSTRERDEQSSHNDMGSFEKRGERQEGSRLSRMDSRLMTGPITSGCLIERVMPILHAELLVKLASTAAFSASNWR